MVVHYALESRYIRAHYTHPLFSERLRARGVYSVRVWNFNLWSDLTNDRTTV